MLHHVIWVHPSVSNNLEEMDQLGYLALCQNLRSLTLEGNPLCAALAEEVRELTGQRR